MTPKYTIPKTKKRPPEQDYSFLREKGLAYIEQLASDLWTDYNVHDPGITTLEMLCYAISDLGYRIGLPMEDLLASPTNNTEEMHRQFFSAKRILPNCPVTRLDYRKLFIDIPEVKNAWLSTTELPFVVDCRAGTIKKAYEAEVDILADHETKTEVRGLHKVRIELEEEDYSEAQIEAAKNKVKALYHTNRNVGEDLDDTIDVVAEQDVVVCVDMELHNDADIETVQAQMLFDIQEYLTPTVRRYSLQELLDKKKSVENIFEGPLLENGFIDNEELGKSQLRETVYVSDLIQVIMAIPGVKVVKSLVLNYCDCDDESPLDQEVEKWALVIKSGFKPVLCQKKSVFNFFKGLLPFRPDEAEVTEKLTALHAAEKARRQAVSDARDDLRMPEGRDRRLGTYQSFQNQFPETYGVGQNGLIGNPSDQRRVQALQLKGYLLFFDQILANYFAHLAQFKELLARATPVWQTYFSQKIKRTALRDVHKLLGDEADSFEGYEQFEKVLEDLNGEQAGGLPSQRFTARRNRLLDHLLGRFAEQFNDYVLLMHSLLGKKRAGQEVLRDKLLLLREYDQLSCRRALGMDYVNAFYKNIDGEPLKSGGQSIPKQVWYALSDALPPGQNWNVSGAQHRIGRLCGVGNYRNHFLQGADQSPFFKRKPEGNPNSPLALVDRAGKVLFVLRQKQDTEAKDLEVMQEAIRQAQSVTNYRMKENAAGKFLFQILNEGGAALTKNSARYDSQEKRLEAIESMIEFLNDTFSDEGIFLVEHLLLRPRKANDTFLPICTDADCKSCATLDPYSFKVSVVLPGYTARFANPDFRRYMENTIRQELPAHVLARICWIGEEQMATFEARYKAWLEYQQGRLDGTSADETDTTLNELIDILNQLYTIYPKGTLHDCEDGADTNPIILGRTQIGTLPETDDDA